MQGAAAAAVQLPAGVSISPADSEGIADSLFNVTHALERANLGLNKKAEFQLVFKTLAEAQAMQRLCVFTAACSHPLRAYVCHAS